ncbi:alpha-1,6-mannosyltransferase [Saccharothrix coeruleofusca]|uniref:polyprenol phosphomannose-dependent alpha 1,6 mannosyltransferase MptB n=1 Tax=Saccharothrix coeruleofusca TaxID=33919 RepID=UPI0027DC4C14|nr:polyprenol phosphomannose-dependent alpha 1,6 mannosyltransferase MptB [Saccharothrix coeruleofusca]MBP2338331.1 alpha-1,6-mannosyltransferase [Saccharothrix coeruleofusca]
MSLSTLDRSPTPSAASPDLLRWTGFGGVLLLTAAAWAGVAFPGRVSPSLAAGVAGLGLVVLSWALLGRAPLPTANRLRWTLALWCGPLLLAPPLFSGDVFSYLAQGEIAARGLDPSTTGPAQALGATSEVVARVGVYWRDTPSPYGPLFSAVERVVTQVSAGDPVMGVLLHRLVGVLGLVLLVWALPRLADAAGASRRAALWLGALNPLVLWHLVGGAHNDSLMLGLMLVGTAVALEALRERVRWWPLLCGVVLIALAAEVKLPALVALAVVGTALARRRGGSLGQFLLAGVGMVLAFAVVSVVVSLLTGIGFGWLRALGTPGSVNSWMAPTNWFGFLTGGIGALFGADITQTMIGVGKLIGSALAAVGIAVLLHRQLRGRIDEITCLGAVLGLLVVLGPVVQPWYLLWAVVPLAACLPAGRARTRLAALVAVFAVLIPPLAGNFAGRVGQLVLGYAAGIALVGLALLVLRKLDRRSPATSANTPSVAASK